ncbi:MAG: FHIPEP family type III secretion protein [Vulcanimicrobiota bacterium]
MKLKPSRPLLALLPAALCLCMALTLARPEPPPSPQALAYQRPLSAYLEAVSPGSQLQILQEEPLHLLVTTPGQPQLLRQELQVLLGELPPDGVLVVPGRASWRPSPTPFWIGSLVCALLALPMPRRKSKPDPKGIRQACIVLQNSPGLFEQCRPHLKRPHVRLLSEQLAKLPRVPYPEVQFALSGFRVQVSHSMRRLGLEGPNDRPDPVVAAQILEETYLSGGPGPLPAVTVKSSRPRRRIFSCPVCDEVFIDEESLRRHQTSHESFQQASHNPRPRLSHRAGAGLALLFLSGLIYFCPRPHWTTQLSLPDPRPLSQREQAVIAEAQKLVSGRLLVLRSRNILVLAAGSSEQPMLESIVNQYAPGPVWVRTLPPSGWRFFPTLPFGLGLLLLLSLRGQARAASQSPPQPAPAAPPSAEPCSLPNPIMARVPDLSLEISPTLTGLNEQLGQRTGAIVAHMAQELGLSLEEIGISANDHLAKGEYLIRLRGAEIARGSLEPDKYLSIGPPEKLKSLRGRDVQDPTYQLPGKWISREQRGDSERLGCMIFHPVAVLATQLTEQIRARAAELLCMGQVKARLEEPALQALAEELSAHGVDRLVIWKVLRRLLDERVCILNLVAILQAIAEAVHLTKDPILLVEFARAALAEAISEAHRHGEQKRLNVITLDPQLQQMLESFEYDFREECLPVPAETAWQVVRALETQVHHFEEQGLEPILLCSPGLRYGLRSLTRRSLPQLVLLSWNEVGQDYHVHSLAMVSLHP